MALSSKTFNTLVDAITSKDAAQELVNLVNARAGTVSPDLQRRLIDGLGRNSGTAVAAALTSGASLTLAVRKKVLIMMAGDATPTGGAHAAGNELINYIQSVPQSTNTTL